MPLEIPNLDDRRWADLVEEARSLIPRVTPRWTDHNVHDPGITFLELFAWLAEMQIYQLNRVGDRHREIFGRLAGVERRLRTPARLNLQAIGALNAGVLVPAGTQITPVEGDEIVFETTTDVTLTQSRLQRVIVNDGTGGIDQTAANEALEIAYLAFGERARAGAELRIGFDAFYPDREPTIRLTADVLTSDLGSRCGSIAPIDSAAPADDVVAAAPVELIWEFLAAGGQWLPLAVLDDGTAAFSRSGTVTLALPAQAARDRDLVWIRSRIVRGYYDIEPRLQHIGLNVLPCAQRETVSDELLGRGNGRPDQLFQLSKSPLLIPESGPAVAIEVNGEAWESAASFDDASPTSRQYVLDVDGGRVIFGNGLNGQVPQPGQDIRAKRYQVSSGRSGNVAQGLHWKFRTLVVPGVTLANAESASGGADPESLNDLELRARAQLSRPQRAVTLGDIEGLALGTPGVYVARAHAIPNCPTPERITVVVVPKVRPGRTGPPLPPSETFLGTVRRHLQQRRLICDDLRVTGPIYIEVEVTAAVRLSKGAGAATVIERARQALDRFLTGEDDLLSAGESSAGADAAPCPTRWPFGRWVFPSEVYAALDRVAGVDAITNLVLTARRNGVSVAADETGAIPIPRIGLVYAGAHRLTVAAATGRQR